MAMYQWRNVNGGMAYHGWAPLHGALRKLKAWPAVAWLAKWLAAGCNHQCVMA